MLPKKLSVFSLRKNTTLTSTTIADGLKTNYTRYLKPFEDYYNYQYFHSPSLEDAYFDAKPMILLIGQYSTGKTTLIQYLIGEDFPGIQIGPEPTTDRFNIIMKGDDKKIIPGNALVMDTNKQFRPLAKFGNAFLNRLQCSVSDAKVLNGICFVDTPGILAGQKQSCDRGYDFTQVLTWFASRVDRILILFDAHKLDISDELRRAIVSIKEHDEKIRIILNKSDLIDPQELMRVYGALMWSLGKVFDTPEVVRVYIGSFWEQPLRMTGNRELFEKEESDLLQDLKGLPKHSSIRKLNDFIKRARSAQIHGLIISELAKRMPKVFGKDNKKRNLIQNLSRVYSDIQECTGLSIGDFPNIDTMAHKLENADWSLFKLGDKKMNDAISKMLNEDLPQLLMTCKPDNESSILNGPIEMASSGNTPFDMKNCYSLWNGLDNENTWIDRLCPELMEEWISKFNKLHPINGKLNGDTVKKDFIAHTKLNKTTLSKIWSLSDVDKDGMLNQNEYCLANYLIYNKMKGKEIPSELPQHLIPPNH